MNKYEVDTWNTSAQGIQGVANQSLSPAAWAQVTPHSKAGDVYLFVQGISFIPDGLNVSRLGQAGVGATKGLVSDGRLDLNASNITFLETNVSFIDGFVRPWSVAVAHRSPKDPKLRCDLELFALQKWSLNEPLEVRKSMVFKNAFPMNIDAEEYNYTGDKIINRQVQFAFDRYETHVHSNINDESITKEAVLSLVDEVNSLGSPAVQNNGSAPSLLQTINNALGAAASLTNRVQGVVNDVTSSASQVLHAVGLEDQADDVSQFNIDFRQQITRPVANVLSTGQGAVQSVQRAGTTIVNITDSNLRSADNIAQSIYNREERNIQLPLDSSSSIAPHEQIVTDTVDEVQSGNNIKTTQVTQGTDIITLEEDDFDDAIAGVGKNDIEVPINQTQALAGVGQTKREITANIIKTGA
jgi:hypothetical protein